MKPITASPVLQYTDSFLDYIDGRLNRANTTAWSWLIAAFGFVGTGIAHLGFGVQFSTEWSILVGAFGGIALGKSHSKRKTEFRPEELARAERIRNGGIGRGAGEPCEDPQEPQMKPDQIFGNGE